MKKTHIADDGAVLEFAGACISSESVELLDDDELVALLKSRGVDTTRPTRITPHGVVYYIIKLELKK